jgi:hypothetical protein
MSSRIAQSTTMLQLQTQLIGVPQQTRLTLSDFYLVPFHDDLDFESFEILGRQRSWPWPRTLLNYTQKYQLLSSVLAAVREYCQGCYTHIIVNSRMPSTIRMPPAMLAEDVFVVLDVEAEALRFVSQGHSVVTLKEGLIRYATESGNNELVINWHLAPVDGTQRMQALALRLQELGFALREVAV